jgi:predicted ATP-dependent endonuclease of OLD family
MFLQELAIEGYRCFGERFEIGFATGLNVLVGENASGKSAVVDALRLLLLEDEFGRTGVVDTDFHRPFTKDAEPVELMRVCATFKGLPKEETVAFLPWTELDGQARLTLEVENKEGKDGRFKRALWGGASRASAFERELFDAIDCVYLPPLRDAEAKLREGKGSRLARLLRNLNHQQLDEHKRQGTQHPLVESVREFNAKLAGDTSQPIAQANELIRTRLQEAVGAVFGQDTQVQFSEANFSRIVESLRLLFFPDLAAGAAPEMFRSLHENSLGYNNLLYLATVLAELAKANRQDRYVRVLLIEEPEAHLHPQLQVRLLRYLEDAAKNEGIQIIVTTHSPVLASSASLGTITHISAGAAEGPVAIPLRDCGLTPGSKAFLRPLYECKPFGREKLSSCRHRSDVCGSC